MKPAKHDDDDKRVARGAGPAKNPGAKPVRTVRIVYSKGGAMTYVSHLDVQRTFMRAIIKSKLPVYYTEGFNPIPKLTFASPLSVGVSGEKEFAQIKLVRDVSDAEVVEKLRAAMPADIKILDAYTGEVDFKKIAWADNVITLHGSFGEGDLEKVNSLIAGPMVVLKKTKSTEKEVDIKPFIKDIRAELCGSDMIIYATTCSDNTNFLNPTYVAKAVKAEIGGEYYEITRKNLMLANGESFR